MTKQNVPRITKVTIDTQEILTLQQLLTLFNNVQGCLSMGHDDGRFILDEKFNLEHNQPIKKGGK